MQDKVSSAPFRPVIKKSNKFVRRLYSSYNLKQKTKVNELAMCQGYIENRWKDLTKIGQQKNPEKSKHLQSLLQKAIEARKQLCAMPRNTRKEMRAFGRSDNHTKIDAVLPLYNAIKKTFT